MNKEEIIAKIKKGLTLTKEEEIFYLTKIVGHSLEKAENIIAISENKNEFLLID